MEPKTLEEFRETFFLTSSRQEFSDETEKEAFFEKWAGYYLKNFEDEIFFAKSEEGRLMGYLTGCRNTLLALPELLKSNPSLEAFEDLYSDYPAHLHINCHPDFQGRGIGGRLIENYWTHLLLNDISGLHLITTPDARNREFYRRHQFTNEFEREWQGKPLLFMGRKI